MSPFLLVLCYSFNLKLGLGGRVEASSLSQNSSGFLLTNCLIRVLILRELVLITGSLIVPGLSDLTEAMATMILISLILLQTSLNF